MGLVIIVVNGYWLCKFGKEYEILLLWWWVVMVWVIVVLVINCVYVDKEIYLYSKIVMWVENRKGWVMKLIYVLFFYIVC